MYLLRHGEVLYFADPDAPVAPEEVILTERGTEQARASGRALAEVRFDRVVCSGLARTRRTAELVVEQLHEPPPCAIEDWPELEEFRPGAPDAIADEELEEHFLQAFRQQSTAEHAFLRGETVASLLERVGVAMERFYDDRAWSTALVVLHGGINRAILSWALAGPGAYFGHIEQAPACINILDGGPDFIVRGINIAPYDPVHHLGPRISTLEDMLTQYRDYRARS